MGKGELNDNQEIDLSYLTKKISTWIEFLGYSIYKFFQFLLKNIILLSVLFILGVAIGYFIDSNRGESYKHEVVVIPNYKSTEYLYSKIENMKLKDSPIQSIEIKPIIDVYDFITSEWNNLEVAKYLSQNNIRFDRYSTDSDVEKFYRYHLLTVITSDKDPKGAVVDSIVNELNKDPFLLERKRVESEGRKMLVQGLEKNVESIEKILDKLGDASVNTAGDVNIEMYPEINELISSKRSALNEINKIKILELEGTEVINPTTKVMSVEVKRTPSYLLYPLIFIGLFFVFNLIMAFVGKYKKFENR